MNTEILSFPGLGINLNINRVAFSIGNFSVYWYGILIAIGFSLGMLYIIKRSKIFGIDVNRMLDVVMVSAIGAIIGARTYYVAFRWNFYKDNISQVFNLRNGGLAIYGGIIGAVIVGFFMCKIRKVQIAPMLDLAFSGFLIGQAIGRWGNFVNIEAFGGNTTLPWGMTSPVITKYLQSYKGELETIGMTIDPNMPVHPTFFYESLWCLIGFIIVVLYAKHRKFDGEISLFYAVWYGMGRFVIEGLRTDSLMIGNTPVRVSQALALVCVIVAIGVWAQINYLMKRKPEKVPPLYATTQESKLIVAQEYDYKTGKAKQKKDDNILEEDNEEDNQQ